MNKSEDDIVETAVRKLYKQQLDFMRELEKLSIKDENAYICAVTAPVGFIVEKIFGRQRRCLLAYLIVEIRKLSLEEKTTLMNTLVAMTVKNGNEKSFN